MIFCHGYIIYMLPLEIWRIIQMSGPGAHWVLVRVCKSFGIPGPTMRKLFVRCVEKKINYQRYLSFILPNGRECWPEDIPGAVVTGDQLWLRYQFDAFFPIDNNTPLVWGTHRTIWCR
jgi:hypothetical protein